MPIVLAHKGIFISSLVDLVHRSHLPGADPERGRAGDRRRAQEGRHAAQPVRDHPRGARPAALRLQLLLAHCCSSAPRTASSTTCGTSSTSTSAACRSRSTTACSRVSSSRVPTPTSAAVQMYLSQAPFILVQCSVVAPRVRARCCRSTFRSRSSRCRRCRSSFIAGVQMRKEMFPVSWLIQARLADVATVVDENIQGVRVVKSFAAENDQLQHPHRTRASGPSGRTSSRPTSAPSWAPLIENLPRLGQALVLLYGGYLAINGQATVGDIAAFNALRAHAAAAVPPARHDDDDGPARGGVGRSASTRCSTSSPTSSTIRARSTSSSARATSTSTT